MKKTDLSNYKAVILGGGQGTRLYPVTLGIPKALLPVHKKPMINYQIDMFFSSGIKKIAVLININTREDFRWWKKRYYPLIGSGQVPQIKFFEERKPLGTFGGLWYLRKWLGRTPFFLINVDNLTTVNLEKMVKFHQKCKKLATIALTKVANPKDYGAVDCKSGIIKSFTEKPKNFSSFYINSGLYLLNSEIFNYHLGPRFLMIENNVFPQLAKEQKLVGFKFNSKWIDCGTWERYALTLKKWK